MPRWSWSAGKGPRPTADSVPGPTRPVANMRSCSVRIKRRWSQCKARCSTVARRSNPVRGSPAWHEPTLERGRGSMWGGPGWPGQTPSSTACCTRWNGALSDVPCMTGLSTCLVCCTSTTRERLLPDPGLDLIKEALTDQYRHDPVGPFCTAGLCLYRDGRDSVAWHGDRIGRGSTDDTLVAIVSLGSPRRMLLRPRQGGHARQILRAGAAAIRSICDGGQLPAHMAALNYQDVTAGRSAHQHPVPSPRRSLTLCPPRHRARRSLLRP